MPTILKKFSHALSGLLYTFRYDRSFQTEIVIGVLGTTTLFYFFAPLSQTEILFIALAWVLVLVTEMQNTALETALDRIHPDKHDAIGKSKDVASGAVFLSILFALVVTLTIVINHLS